MEPDSTGIWHTAIRSLLVLGRAGPMLTMLFMATLGLLGGLMLAGSPVATGGR